MNSCCCRCGRRYDGCDANEDNQACATPRARREAEARNRMTKAAAISECLIHSTVLLSASGVR